MSYAAQIRILGSITELRPKPTRGACLAHLQLECMSRRDKLRRDGEAQDAADMEALITELRGLNPFAPMRSGYFVWKRGVYTIIRHNVSKPLPHVL